MFYLISNELNKISKRYPFLCEEFESEKKKWQKNFDLPERGFEPQIFSNFPPKIWIFIESEEAEIKSRQGS